MSKASIFFLTSALITLPASSFGQAPDSNLVLSFESFGLSLEQVGDAYYSWDCESPEQSIELATWLNNFQYQGLSQSVIDGFVPSGGFDDMIWARTYYFYDGWIVVAMMMEKDNEQVLVGCLKVEGAKYWR